MHHRGYINFQYATPIVAQCKEKTQKDKKRRGARSFKDSNVKIVHTWWVKTRRIKINVNKIQFIVILILTFTKHLTSFTRLNTLREISVVNGPFPSSVMTIEAVQKDLVKATYGAVTIWMKFSVRMFQQMVLHVLYLEKGNGNVLCHLPEKRFFGLKNKWNSLFSLALAVVDNWHRNFRLCYKFRNCC